VTVAPHALGPFLQLQIRDVPIRPAHLPPGPEPSTLPHARRPLFLDHTTCCIDRSPFQKHYSQLKHVKGYHEKLEPYHHRPQFAKVACHSTRIAPGRGERASARLSERRSHRHRLSFGWQRHTTDPRQQESIGLHNSARPEGLREQKTCRGSHQKS
jgi:hypothetical protein